MLVQRVIRNHEAGTASLIINAESASAVPELLALADDLKLRSTMRTDGPIHYLNDPQGNGEPVVS